MSQGRGNEPRVPAELGGVALHAAVNKARTALHARDQVHVIVEHGLSRSGTVELVDADAVG